MSSIKNSWTQGRSKESHPPGIVFPIIATKQSSPWLPAPNGIKHFYCRVSCHFSSPGLGYIGTAHLHLGGWREIPLWDWDSPTALSSYQASDWSPGSIAGFWLAGGNTGQSDLTGAARPNIPKSCCNSNILIFYQWLANSNRRKIKLTFSSSTQLQIWNNIIIICLSSDAITPGLSPECEENCKFD